MRKIEQPLSFATALDMSVVRILPDDRFVLLGANDRELVCLSHSVPGVASVGGRSVHLTAERRGWRLAVVAQDGLEELGCIQLSWIPGRHRIRSGGSEFRAIRRLFRGGWNLNRQGIRVATIELNGWFSPDLGLRGRSQINAGSVVLAAELLGPDVLLALLLLLEMLAYDSVPVPAASTGA